jgi:hypothetical protein
MPPLEQWLGFKLSMDFNARRSVEDIVREEICYEDFIVGFNVHGM